MRNLTFFLLLLFVLDSFGQAEKAFSAKPTFVRKILHVNRILRKFENRYEKEIESKRVSTFSYVDSITKYNYILSCILSDPGFCSLKDSELKTVADLTEIKISSSRDKKVKVVSWCVYNPFPNQMCSNIIVSGNKEIKAISLNSTGAKDFGDNIAVDTIIDISLNDKVNYLLIGSNKCGSLCMQRIASIYTIFNGNIVRCRNAFFNGTNNLDEIEFNYLLNEEIKEDLIFHVENTELVCPVFNEDRTRQIGSRRVKMLGRK